MDDIHKGFQDVIQVAAAEGFFQFLDAADALESIQACLLDLYPPKPGQRILDVGCGIGHSTLRLAGMVGDTGSVVGLDKSEALIAEAQKRAAGRSPSPEYQVGDARNLDFAAQSFDVCRTERVLMYVEQPAQVLDEMLRVLTLGGLVALFEFDYDVTVVDASDQSFTRRLVRFHG